MNDILRDQSDNTANEIIDIAAFIEDTKHQIFNGNISKAKNLGSSIVSSFSYKDAPEYIILKAKDSGLYITEDVLLQIKILSVFTAEYAINRFLNSSTLTGVAISEFYAVLEQMYPDLYSELSKTSFFAFYHYYSTKKEEDFAEKIGEQFAAACSEPGNVQTAQFGTWLFRYNIELYKTAFIAYGFV